MERTVRLEPELSNVSGVGHAPISTPWGINRENAQFLDVVTKLFKHNSWNETFLVIVLDWLCSRDEAERLNIAAHLDQSSNILSGFVLMMEREASTNELLAEEIRGMLEDLHVIHDNSR